MTMAEIEKRTSGRTTRMIEHAIRLAKTGWKVYVVLAHRPLCTMWEREVAIRTGDDSLNIQFETEDTIGDDIDWSRMRLKEFHPNNVLLIDHAVIESKFRNVFRVWQQYDNPRGQGYERLVDGIPARERSIDSHVGRTEHERIKPHGLDAEAGT